MGLLVVIAMCFSLIPANCVFAAQVITENKTGNQSGYDYELWKDYGNTSMTLNSPTTFSCQWSNIGNALFRIGKKFGSTKTYQELGNISVNYACDYKPNGNSYLCVYGWTQSPLVEYYVVDSWGTWRPPGATPKGQITVDGGTYDVYETTRVNKPSIEGDTTFKQYWSVRTSKRTSGTISLSEHFKKWEAMGLKMGKMYEAALTVEGYESSGSANVTKNDIVVGGSVSPQPENPSQPQNPTTPVGNYATLKDGWYYIKDNNSQKYLQVKGNTGADGQNVEIGTGTGAQGQKWYLKNVGDGYVTLKNGTGYALDVVNGENEDSTNVQVYTVHGLDGQLFKLLKTQKDGVYGIVTKCSTDTKGLDVEDKSTADGANVQQYSYYGGANQVWVLESCDNTKPTEPTDPTDPIGPVGNYATLKDGWYYIKDNNSQNYLQVTNNTGADGQNVEVGKGTGVEGQKWYLKNVGDGYVTLKNGTGYALDVVNGENEDSTNVQVYTPHGLTAQLFKLIKTQKDGQYGIVTKCSSDTKGLDVEDKSTSPGANVQQYSYWGGPNQVWVLEPCNGSSSSTGSTTKPEEEKPVQPATDAVSAKITSDWGSGAAADITVTNTTGKDLNNWTCTFTTSRPITSVWNATIVSQSGNTYTVTGPAWQTSLANGASYTFGCQLGGGSGLTVSNATLK